MQRWKLVSGVAVAVVLVAGTAVALAGPRFPGARETGMRAYWSLLDDAQKAQAKEIAADYLAETAPDLYGLAARVLRLRGDVAAVLTVEQRREAVRLHAERRGWTQTERGARLERLLATMDRDAVARDVERLESAPPEERVTTVLDLLDRFRAAAEPGIVDALKLSADQVARIHALADEAKADVRPVAVRVVAARDAAKAKGLALLDASQRARLDEARATGRGRLLGVLRGR